MTPNYSLSLGGEVLRNRLEKLQITDKSGTGGDLLTLILQAENLTIPNSGVLIEAKIGYEETGLWPSGDSAFKFVVQGTILKYTKQSSLKLHIYGISQAQGQKAFTALQTTKTEKTWQEGTLLGEIINDITNPHGLTAMIDPKLESIVMPLTTNMNKSDAAFLDKLAKDRDAFVKYSDKTVVFSKHSQESLGTLDLPFDNNVLDFEYTQMEPPNVGAVKAKWQDHIEGATKFYIHGDPDGGIKVIPTLFPDEITAHNAAESLYNQLHRDVSMLRMSCITKAGMLAEKVINLSNFPNSQIDGKYTIKEVIHTFSKNSGLTSHLIMTKLP